MEATLIQPPLKPSISFLPNTNFKKRVSYKDRIKICKTKVAQRLLTIVEEKKSNLAVAADVITKKALLDLVHAIGPSICILKTHIDIITDFDHDLVMQLKTLAKQYNFLIFEDRKFADIGVVVQQQYSGGMYKIMEWSDLVTVHLLPGIGILKSLEEASKQAECGLILLPQMSTSDNFLTPEYTQKTLAAASLYEELVCGFIAQEQLLDDSFIYFVPGVQLQEGSDSFGQRYATPSMMIDKGIDIIIVGRGIYQSIKPAATAEQYRKTAWDAYEQSLNHESK
jgi:orotidine 5'-phosphate decarboxylase subfamily 1